MDFNTSILIFAIAIVLIFDLLNGFHDAANSIASIVSTHVLSPNIAVLWAAFFNFIALLIFPPSVASTLSKIIYVEASDISYVYVVMAGVISAIIWNLLTWWWGMPVSSSHALVGGVIGSGIAYAGWSVVDWESFFLIVTFIFVSPLIGFILASIFMLALSWGFRNYMPRNVDRIFSKGQLVSAALYSIGHGANDAQKMMGIILALLWAGGHLEKDVPLSLSNPQTAWIILSCQLMMAIGTGLGGWRIVKTVGMRITRLKPPQGFCAETGGASAIFIASLLGVPVSTTHTIVGGMVGVGSVSHKTNNIRWDVASRIVWAWVLTIPLTALLAAFLLWTGTFISTLI